MHPTGRFVILIGALCLPVGMIRADVISDTLRAMGSKPGAPELDGRLQEILNDDFRAGRFEAALAKVRPLTRAYADHPEVWFVLGAVSLQRQEWSEAIVAADRSLQLRVDWLPAYGLKGIALTAAGRNEEAERVFDRTIQLAPKDPGPRIQRGTHFLHRKTASSDDYRRALADFEQALRLGAIGGGVLTLIGQTHLKLKDPTQAESSFRRALSEDPTDVAAVTEIVALCDGSNRGVEGSRWLDAAGRAIAGRPDDPEVRGQLELVRARHGRHLGEAPARIERSFRDAIAQAPLLTVARSEFAEWLDSQGRTREAVPVLREGLREPPFDPHLAANLAWALAESGSANDMAEARRWLAIARKLEPNDPYLADTAAWIEHRAGDDAKALQMIGPALKLVDQVPEVAYHLGVIQAGLGRREEARRSLRQALDARRPFPGEGEAKKLLRTLTSG